MKELSFDELKSTAFDVLCEIDKICNENGFLYSLAYGTLLGAVRHQGFIPWDDDIDIMMPRADYLKFIDYCKNNETAFKIASVETDPEYGYIFAKACDDRTVIHYENAKWNRYGVQVDIFPIDDLGSDLAQAKKRFGARRFQRELLVAWNWKTCKWNKSRSFSFNIFRLAFYCLSRFASNRALASSIKKYYEDPAFENSDYVGIVCGAYRDREVMPASIYKEYTELPFENKKFRVIAEYDQYLTAVYGDYMQLPPEEKRVPRHNFKVYWK